MKNMTAKRITTDALLCCVALVIFILEAQIPAFIPIPGVKLGLANIITVYAMFRVGPKDTLAILVCRIILGSIFSGQLISFLFSLTGGIFCYFAMLFVKRFLSEKQIWICSIIGAVFHNLGQMTVAVPVTGTFSVLVYLPALIASGIITGLFTGVCAQVILNHMDKIKLKK